MLRSTKEGTPPSTLAAVASPLLLVIKISIFTTVAAWENPKAKRREHLLSSPRSSLEQKRTAAAFREATAKTCSSSARRTGCFWERCDMALLCHPRREQGAPPAGAGPHTPAPPRKGLERAVAPCPAWRESGRRERG